MLVENSSTWDYCNGKTVFYFLVENWVDFGFSLTKLGTEMAFRGKISPQKCLQLNFLG